MRRYRLFLLQLLVALVLQGLMLGKNGIYGQTVGQSVNAGITLKYKVINEAKRWVELTQCVYSGAETEVKIVVPQRVTLNGKIYAVYAVGEAAFKNVEGLVSVTIQPGVARLEADCFDQCNTLREVNLPDGLTYIGDRAFQWVHTMQKVNVPPSVTYIGESVFSQCQSLQHIVLPEGLTLVPEHAFYNCKSLRSVKLPQSVLHIGEEAFFGCNELTELSLPKQVRTIGENAFIFCSKLQSMYLPATVSSIADGAFNGCDQLRLSVDSNNSHYVVRDYMLFSHELDTLLCCNETAGENVCLPDNVQVIAPKAAQYNSLLKRMILSPTLIEMGESAFGNCDNLENIELPASLSVVGDEVFKYCDHLKQIVLPCTDAETATHLYKAMRGNLRSFIVPDDCEELKPLLATYQNMKLASAILPRPNRKVADMVFKPFAVVSPDKSLWQMSYNALRGLALLERLSVEANQETISNYEKAVLKLPRIDEFRINYSRCYTENDLLACLESSIACRGHEYEVVAYIKNELVDKLGYKMEDMSNKRKGAAKFTKWGTDDTIFVIPDPDWERVFLLNVNAETDCYKRVISRFDE